MQEGWAAREEERPDLLPYNRRRYELSTEGGCVVGEQGGDTMQGEETCVRDIT